MRVQTSWKVLGRDGRHGFAAIARGLEPKAARIVAKVAMDLQAQAQGRAPVRTGTLKGSIRAIQIDELHWVVVVGADYGLYVEWGTRYMNAQPYLQPSVMMMRPVFRAALSTLLAA
jgi:HK97 gp10 family phage protein